MQIQLNKNPSEMALELANFFTKKTKVKFSPEDFSHLSETKIRCLYGKFILKMTYGNISNFLLNKPVSSPRIREHLRLGIIYLFRHFIKDTNPEKAMAFNNFRARTAIIESMDVRVHGANYKRVDTLDNLGTHLIDNALMPVLKSLPPDQRAYFDKNKMGSVYDMFAPDGSYYSSLGGGTGIINFYISGLTVNSIKRVLQLVVAILKKRGIKFGKFKREQSGMYKSEVIRIPIESNPSTYSGPPELNISNANSYHIFHTILQYEGTNNFSMKAQELKERIESIFSGDPDWISQHQIKPTDTQFEPDVPGDEWKSSEEEPEENPHLNILKQIGKGMGARMISGGLNQDQIRKRLYQIYNIADWATKHGYDNINVN